MPLKTLIENSESRTLTETTYRMIRADILTRALAPKAKLRIDELRDRYGSGSSAVRESLSRLVSENLVSAEEQKGFRVASMSVSEFRDITDLRVLLEEEATRKAIAYGDEAWEAQIVATYHRLERAELRMAAGEIQTISEWEDRNRDFHDALVSACGSEWLMRVRSTLYDHATRYRHQSLLAGLARRDTSFEHKMMRDSALARDAETAVNLVRQHFKTTFVTYEASAAIIAVKED